MLKLGEAATTMFLEPSCKVGEVTYNQNNIAISGNDFGFALSHAVYVRGCSLLPVCDRVRLGAQVDECSDVCCGMYMEKRR